VLQQALISHQAFTFLAVLDAGGKETVRAADVNLFPDSGRPATFDEVIRAAAAGGRLSVSPVVEIGGKPFLLLAYPLLTGGRMLLAAYDLSELWRRLGSLKVGSDGRVLILDTAGHPLLGVSDDFPEKGWKGPGELPGESGWLDRVSTPLGNMVGAYVATPSLKWRVLTLQLQKEAFAVGDRFMFRAAFFLLVLVGLTLSMTYWVAQGLTKPLEQLIRGSKRVSHNDFERPVADAGWGELSLLSKAFNEMMVRLKAVQELNVERVLEEKAKVESLVHTIPDGIVLTGFDGSIKYVNASARSLLSVSSLDTMPTGLNVHQLLRQPALKELLGAVLQRRRRGGTAEVDFADSKGRLLGTFFCRAATVASGSKEIGALIILRDVTAERNLDKMKEEFFHSIVHDLRGPIGTIDGFVQIMAIRTTLGEKEKTYVGYIQESCERLRGLVSDILDTAKMESGTFALNLGELDLPALIERMRKLYTLSAQTKGIELKFETGPQPSRRLKCDRELISRVVMNLIGNAMKFTPQSGRITLSVAAAAEREMEFCVQDTGHGIPKDKLQLVFEKFKQIEQGSPTRSGYGLGLAICKKVVELHGGRIWAESEGGKGSRFIFRLPLDPPQQQAAASS